MSTSGLLFVLPRRYPGLTPKSRKILDSIWDCFHSNAPLHHLDRYEYTTYALAMRILHLNPKCFDMATRTVINGYRGQIERAFVNYVTDNVIYSDGPELKDDYWLKIITTYTLALCVAKELHIRRQHKDIETIFQWTARTISQRFGEKMQGNWVSYNGDNENCNYDTQDWVLHYALQINEKDEQYRRKYNNNSNNNNNTNSDRPQRFRLMTVVLVLLIFAHT